MLAGAEACWFAGCASRFFDTSMWEVASNYTNSSILTGNNASNPNLDAAAVEALGALESSVG